MTTGVAAMSPAAEVKKESNAAGREAFLEVYQQLKKELLCDNELVTYTDESRAWVEEVGSFWDSGLLLATISF